MRKVLVRAALVACASAALSASTGAQTPSTDPARGASPAMAASAAAVPAAPTPDAPGVRPPVLGTRAPANAPVPGVRPQAPTDTTPPATVQTPSTRPRAPADRATPPVKAPGNVSPGVDPLRANPARATDPANLVDPAAADPSRLADPTRAPEKAPRGDAGAIEQPLVHVAVRDARTGDPGLDVRAQALDAPSHALAACMRERDRAVRARCAHGATEFERPDAFDAVPR